MFQHAEVKESACQQCTASSNIPWVGNVPKYRVVRLDPGGRGLMYDGKYLSHHTFKAKADPIAAAQERVYIEWLRQKEAEEQAQLTKQEKKERKKK